MVASDSAPQLSGETPSGGSFSFQLAGVPFATYVVQASTNLGSWQAVGTNVLPASGLVSVTDTHSTAFSHRYYRAVQVLTP